MTDMKEYMIDGEELMVRMYEAATQQTRPPEITAAEALASIGDPEQVLALRLAAQAAFEYIMECTDGFGRVRSTEGPMQ